MVSESAKKEAGTFTVWVACNSVLAMDADIFGKLVQVAIYFVPFLFALCVHEFAHGWVALKRGDRTALLAGRLTLNPMAHADPIGTFILPLASLFFGSPIFFGWAKPVPVNSRNLKNPRTDMFWVAFAGPLSNILMAFIGAFGLVFASKYMTTFSAGTLELLKVFVQLNLFLAVFNLLPIHPLDGGKVIARFIPIEWNRKLEDNQQAISIALLFLFMTGAMSILAYPVRFLAILFIRFAELIL